MLGNIISEILCLPIIHRFLRNFKPKLWQILLSQFTFLSIKVNYLISKTINVFLKIDLINYKLFRQILRIKHKQSCHLIFFKNSRTLIKFIDYIYWSKRLIGLFKNSFLFKMVKHHIIKDDQ